MRILITGASGQLGAYVLDELASGEHEVLAWSGSTAGDYAGCRLITVDLTDPPMITRSLDSADPDVILHLAAISAAEEVRRDPERAQAINVEATRQITAWCGSRGRHLVFTSTDLVFDGSRPWNRETDPTGPLLRYGQTKVEAEGFVAGLENGLVARLSLLYGFTRIGRPAFFDKAIAALRNGQPQTFFADEYRTPLDYATAAAFLVALAKSHMSGILHVGGTERVSRYELMRRAAEALGLDAELVRANRRADVTLAEPRPEDVSLETTRLGEILPDLKIRPLKFS